MGSLRISAFFLLLPVFGLLSGCTLQNTADSSSVPGSAISGTIFGGQQPIGQAHVYLFAVGTGSYGTASTSLLKAASTGQSDAIGAYVLTSNTGSFTVSGDYTCPTPTTPVYLYSLGGTPETQSLGPNSLASFIIGLGQCGSAGSAVVSMNEVTTVATAYALAGFATDATHISTSGSPLALTGLNNAMSTIGNIVNTSTGVARTTTIAGNGTVPAATINTLANILASCVNTNGALIAGTKTTTASNCYTLVNNAASAGTSGTPAPETATAAINMAHYPGAAVATLFALQPGIGAPNVGLTTQPNDFALTVAYTGGGLTPQYTNGVDLAVDGSGNLWVANSQGAVTNSSGTTLSKFNPLGVPANPAGYIGGPNQLSTPYGLAISSDSAHVWMGNYDHGSIVDFNVTTGTGTEHLLPNGDGVLCLAFDSSGNLWGGDANKAALLKISGAGSVLNTYTGNGLVTPDAIAVSPTATGKIWVADSNGSFNVFSNTGALISNPSIPNQAESVALDASGNAWTVTSLSTGGTVFKMNASGSGSTAYTLPGQSGSDIFGAAMDGASNLWITGLDFTSGKATNNRIWAVNNSGVAITGPSVGLVPYPANTTQPSAIAVDGSGNVWYTSSSDATLHQIVGAGAPVVTPVAAAVVNNTLGRRP